MELYQSLHRLTKSPQSERKPEKKDDSHRDGTESWRP